MHFKAINVDVSSLPKKCFPDSFLEEILQESKRVESALVPDFFHNGGEDTLEEDFQKIKMAKYCELAVNKILETYDLLNAFNQTTTDKFL